MRPILFPAQIVADGGVTDTVGRGFTVTVTVALEVQLPAPVPITVYVVVAVGLARGFAQVVHERPVAGLHNQAFAPEAVSGALPPWQKAGAGGDTLTVGSGFTVTVTVAVTVGQVPPETATV